MRIQLTNFQAHSETVLELDGGFCCLLGSTNSGKSSLVRALKWIFYNSLRGKRFIKDKQKFAEVQVQFQEGTVGRKKGTQENSYTVNGTLLTTVGASGVPVEATKLTNITPLKIDGDDEIELHVASQMSPPFLISEPDSMKSKALNLLTGSNVFDVAIKQTQKIIRDSESSKKVCEESAKTIEEQLKGFADLDEQERKLNALESLIVRFEQINQTIITLNEAKQVLSSNKAQVEQLRVDLGNCDLWIPKLERAIVVEGLLTELKVLDMLKTSRRGLETELSEMEQGLEKCKKEILELPDSICGECGQVISRKAREAMV